MAFRNSWRRRVVEIEPDEIFIDSSNIPQYDREQFEGRIERPIEFRVFWFTAMMLAVLFLSYSARAWHLMVNEGEAYATQAAENQLSEQVVFANRGVIFDRAGRELAFNEKISTTSVYADRTYAPYLGVAHVVGYTKPPAEDSSGQYYRDTFEGIDGSEQAFDEHLRGENGRLLTEVNARGEVVSQSRVEEPKNGEPLTLSVDAEVSQALYRAIEKRALESGFKGGAGIIIDVRTGELLSLVSYPEYSLEGIAQGKSEVLESLNADTREPFLDRAVDGLYAPGSIIKPFVAAAALEEGVIDEETQILSTGSLVIENLYDPQNPSVFKDWKAHGYTNIREALAVSSDVFFYQVGGGYGSQEGLGIARLERYFKLFGLGGDAGLTGFSSKTGTIPTPQWKEETFDGDPWRLGNTYHTAIGQYGLQVTPLQMVRAIGAIANGGYLLLPTLLASSTPEASRVAVGSDPLFVVREGMHMAASEGGTAAAVSLPFVEVGAKTGTAQVGAHNEFMNSWIVGFYPYENPRWAFALVLERAQAGTLIGAPAAMNEFFWWLNHNAPYYLD